MIFGISVGSGAVQLACSTNVSPFSFQEPAKRVMVVMAAVGSSILDAHVLDMILAFT